MTGATCEPGNPYAIPVMVTGLVPLFLMSSRSTILPFGVSFDIGATSGRYVAFPFCTGSTLMLRLGADIRLPPKIFVVQLSYFFSEAYKAPPITCDSAIPWAARRLRIPASGGRGNPDEESSYGQETLFIANGGCRARLITKKFALLLRKI